MSTTPNLKLELVPTNTLQPSVPVNADLQLLDVIVQLVFESITVTDPPVTTSDDIGKCWAVPAGATGVWSSQSNNIAVCVGATMWRFVSPNLGWIGSMAANGDVVKLRPTGWVVIDGAGGGATAEDITFDPTVSGLSALNVQDAIDELSEREGSGDVVGPASATADTLVIFDGATGKKVKDSGRTIASLKAIGVVSTVTAGSITPAADTDIVRGAALAAALTIANPLANPIDGWGMVVELKDNGTSRALTWGTMYASRCASLPTATVAGKQHVLCFGFNSADGKLYCDAAAVQP